MCRFVVALVTACLSQWASATPSPVSLLSGNPAFKPLVTCLESRLGNATPAERLAEGLEFRLILRSQETPDLLLVESLLKPDLASILAAHSHEDDPEAQPAAAHRFMQLLRIPLETRVWVWRKEKLAAVCREISSWITALRSKPVLLDHLNSVGMPF